MEPLDGNGSHVPGHHSMPLENRRISTENRRISTENRRISTENRRISMEDQPISMENQSMSINSQIIAIQNQLMSIENQPMSMENQPMSMENQPMPMEFQQSQPIDPKKLFSNTIPQRRSSAPTRHPKSPRDSDFIAPAEQQGMHMQALYLERPQNYQQPINQNLPPAYHLPEIPPSRASLDLIQQQQQQQPRTPQGNDNQQYASNNENPRSIPPPPYPYPEQQQQQQQQEHQAHQQQQANDQQARPEASTSGGGEPPTTPSKRHDINTLTLCNMAQHTVQEIVVRTQEVFAILKTVAPPNGRLATEMYSKEQNKRFKENVTIITFLFKRLRRINNRCTEDTQDVQGIDFVDVESLIPMKDDPKESKFENRKDTEAYRTAEKKRNEYLRQVIITNRTLKEIANHMRRLISEINTMLAMRKTELGDEQ